VAQASDRGLVHAGVRTQDIGYLSGYDSARQPAPVWAPTSGTTLTFNPTLAGHYTVHVRALVSNGTTTRRAAYEGTLTYLVQ
jgi:hypothetical protein